jgi:hypothetical protein
MRRDITYYDLHAQDVKLQDITSSSYNASILRRLRDDIPFRKGNGYDLFVADEDIDDGETFVAKEGDDWGWLGYFIGRNKTIRFLGLHYCLIEEEDDVVALMEGIKHNRSLDSICVNHGSEVVSITEHLFPFIVHNSNLNDIRLVHDDIGFDCARSLAAALKQRQHKSLTGLYLRRNNLSNEALAEIIDALSGYEQLKSFYAEEELNKRNEEYYDMLAQIIDLRNITSCKKNREILRKLRDNAWDEDIILTVRNYPSEDNPGGVNFCAEEDDDWGWLGYFIGKNKQIRTLDLAHLTELECRGYAFMNGLCRNDSIEGLRFHYTDIDFGLFSHFIIHNSNLKDLRFFYVDIGLENARSLAMALQQRLCKSLTGFCINGNNIEDEALGEITTALRSYPYLKELCVATNSLIGRGGCESLGTIIRSAALHVKDILFVENDFDDGDLQTLVAALTNTSSLRQLDLSRNRSITATGLRALARLFHSSCLLETLLLGGMNIGDEGAEVLADGLMGNTSLKHLVITPISAGITSSGWSAFSRLLCDDSSINNTYQSNHTLEHIGGDYYYMPNPDGSRFHSRGGFQGIPSNVAWYLKMNKKYSMKDTAKIKIINSHPDIPVEVFFQYKLKLLPFLVRWFGRFGVSKCRTPQKRELSAVYKFIRGMPMLVVDSQVKLKCSCGRKRKHDE